MYIIYILTFRFISNHRYRLNANRYDYVYNHHHY